MKFSIVFFFTHFSCSFISIFGEFCLSLKK